MSTTTTLPAPSTPTKRGAPMRWRSFSRRRPILAMVIIRALQGIVILWVVSVLIFAATAVLPGNVAVAILGKSATAESIEALSLRLNLHDPAVTRYFSWLGGLLSGNPGDSLANSQPLWPQVAPRLFNSMVLVLLAGALGSLFGVALGVYVAFRRDRAIDHITSTVLLVITALPEFVIGIVLVILFATVVWPILPAVSTISPGDSIWAQPDLLVLPVLTLVLVVMPYVFRMTRAAMVEALESNYVEMARLKGVSERRVLLRHALPNAAPPIVQVIGIIFLYLAGGIVVVEYIFAFPGIGEGLVNAVSSRDVPTIQLLVLLLACFYVVMNVLTDALAVALTPRRRFPR